MPSIIRRLTVLSLLGTSLWLGGCVATVPAMLAMNYAFAGASLGITGATMRQQTAIAQQNADTYRQSVHAHAVVDAPQCREPAVREACPLYQYRIGVYRGKCQDGSGLEVTPGKLTVIPPPADQPHPWQAEGCTL